MQHATNIMPAIPRELGIISTIIACPSLPQVPIQYYGKVIFLMLFVHSGALEDAPGDIAKITSFGTPIVSMVTRMPWVKAN
ncbi:hypothetical protein SB780_36220, partial [Burkholderia sp. SIMBA_057]